MPDGSIPAPAGEPQLVPRPHCATTVYPRACGGTQGKELVLVEVLGLSPRLRGNRAPRVHVGSSLRSIPAPAGEPRQLRPLRLQQSVYPRACGGTAFVFATVLIGGGLSPRLRGNRQRGPGQHRLRGSIPAPAGEPSATRRPRLCLRVYPRACGGTTLLSCSSPPPRGLSPRLRGNLTMLTRASPITRSIPAPAGEPGIELLPAVRGAVYPRACGGTAD